MGLITDTEKFQLWEKNGYYLYYKLRDIELHLKCLQETAQSVKEMLNNKSKEDLSIDIMQKTLILLRDRIKETKQVLDDIEKSIKK